MSQQRASHRSVIGLIGLIGAVAVAEGLGAAPAGPGNPALWVTPAIDGYGRVYPRPDAPVRPNPAITYRLIVDVITVDRDPAKLANSLDRLARLVNLFAFAGVRAEQVHIVAVLDESAGLLALTDAAYRARFHVANPNLELLHRLSSYGAQLMVCSQAMSTAGLTDSDMSPDVTVTLSALTDFAVFGQRGYSYLRL